MRLIFLSLVIIVITLSFAIGQTAPNGIRRAGNARDSEARRQVLATDDRRREALLRGDASPLRQIYADDYTLVTPAGVIHSKTDQIDDLTFGRLRYLKIEVTERTVRVYGDIIVILSREKTDIVRAGQQVGGDIRVTRIYKRFGPYWRVIATHASVIEQ
jgi:ketosteroid isomerase-like protein